VPVLKDPQATVWDFAFSERNCMSIPLMSELFGMEIGCTFEMHFLNWRLVSRAMPVSMPLRSNTGNISEQVNFHACEKMCKWPPPKH
jgi:hypothetical protein